MTKCLTVSNRQGRDAYNLTVSNHPASAAFWNSAVLTMNGCLNFWSFVITSFESKTLFWLTTILVQCFLKYILSSQWGRKPAHIWFWEKDFWIFCCLKAFKHLKHIFSHANNSHELNFVQTDDWLWVFSHRMRTNFCFFETKSNFQNLCAPSNYRQSWRLCVTHVVSVYRSDNINNNCWLITWIQMFFDKQDATYKNDDLRSFGKVSAISWAGHVAAALSSHMRREHLQKRL